MVEKIARAGERAPSAGKLTSNFGSDAAIIGLRRVGIALTGDVCGFLTLIQPNFENFEFEAISRKEQTAAELRA